MNRLSRYCDGLIEMTWLLTVIFVPLYFFLEIDKPFGLGKTIFFRTIILIGITAWGFKWVDNLRLERRSLTDLWKRIASQPLILLSAALAIIYILSSLFSISPRISLLGTYQRYEGLSVLLAYILLFGLTASNLKSRQQVDRLISTVAAVSFIVDFYALLQHFGFDSINWAEFNVTDRNLSTIGHPIFLAAFLGLTLMLLLGRIIFLIHSYRKMVRSHVSMLILATLYGIVAVLNLLSIWYSGSRGPLIALLFGLFFFVLSILIYFQLRRVFFIFAAISILFLGFITVLNIQNGPLSALRDKPFIGPLGHIFDAETGTGRTRVLIWNGAMRLVLPHDPIRIPNTDSVDRWNNIRPLVGYGPSTLSLVYEDYYLPEMFSMESYDLLHDHAHNEFWDVLALYGVFGFIVEYGFFLSLIYFSLKSLGWIASAQEIKLYWLLSLLGGLIGGLLALGLLGAEYLGLGIPLGLLLGAVAILFTNMLRRDMVPSQKTDLWRDMILVSALALIVSHYVEILFGIPVLSTRIIFWSACGILLAVGQGVNSEPAKVSSQSRTRLIGIHAGLAVAISLALAPGFIVNTQGVNNAPSIFVNSLTSNSYGIFWMFMLGLLFTILVSELESFTVSDRKVFLPNFILSLGIALFVSFLLWMLYATQVAAMSQTPFSNTTRMLGAYLKMVNIQFGTLTLFAYILALLLQEPVKGQTSPVKPLAIVGFGLIHILIFILSIQVNLRPLQANGVARLFNRYIRSGQYLATLNIDETLLELDPQQDAYFFSIAETLARYASTLPAQQNVTGYLMQAEGYYKQAYELNPLYFRTAMGMANINRLWARVSQDPTIRLTQADQYYEDVLDGRPYRVKLWVEWADFHAEFGDYEGAQQRFNTALEIDPTYAPVYLYTANMYMNQAEQQSDLNKRAEFMNKALQDVNLGIEMKNKRGENPSLAFLQLGRVYASLQQYDQARDAFMQAASFGAGDYQWEVYLSLSNVFESLNDVPSQRKYLQQAIAIAPPDVKPTLQIELDALPR